MSISRFNLNINMLFFLKKSLDYKIDKLQLIALGKDIQQIENINECRAQSQHIDDCDELEYPLQLGKQGRLGVSIEGKIINRDQYNSLISKIHIALSDEDFKSPKWKRKTAESRTSDNYVLYIKHPNISNCILILGVISPDAHSRIENEKSLIQKLINIANSFTNLDSKNEILECDNFIS